MLRKKKKSLFKMFIRFIDKHPILAPLITASLVMLLITVLNNVGYLEVMFG